MRCMSSQETSRPVGVVQAKVQFTIGLELFFYSICFIYFLTLKLISFTINLLFLIHNIHHRQLDSFTYTEQQTENSIQPEVLKTHHEGQKAMYQHVNITPTLAKLTCLIDTAHHAQLHGTFQITSKAFMDWMI